MAKVLKKEDILEALKEVVDPDLRINIVDLGLIYGVEILECTENSSTDCKRVEVDMTLTSPACPIAPQLQAAAYHAIIQLDAVEEALVNLVFSPPWDPRVHPSEDAKMDLGIY